MAQTANRHVPTMAAVNAYKGLFLVAAAVVGACTSAPPKAVAPPLAVQPVEAIPKPNPAPKLPGTYTEKGVTVKIDALWRGVDGEILGVSGTAKNVAASDLRFCQISLAFLDEAGSKLDGAKASTKMLKSAQVWRFQAALAHPSQAPYALVTPEKVIAIPVKIQKADLANLH